MEINITAQDENKVLSQSADIPDSHNASLNEQQNVECANTSKSSDFASETIVSFLTPVSSPALLSPIKSVLTFSNEVPKIQPEAKSSETEKCDGENENIQKTETIVQNENSQVNERNYNSPKKVDNKNIKFNYQVNRKIYGKNKRTSHVGNIPSLFDIKTVKPDFMSPQNNFPQLQRFDNQNFSPQYNIGQPFMNYNLPQFNENPNFPLQFNELPAFAQNQNSPQLSTQGLMDQNPLNFNIQRFDDQNCPIPFNSLNEQNLLQLNISQFEVHNHPQLAPFSSDQNIGSQLPFFDRQLPSATLSSNINEDDDQNPNHLSNIQLPADSIQTDMVKDGNPAVSVDKQDNLKTSDTSNTVKTEVKYSPEDTLLDKPMESEKYPEQKEPPTVMRPVLGREQAKKRLQAFSLMKFGLAKQDKNKKVVSPVKKVQLTVEEAYDENGEKIEVFSVKKPPKKGPCHLERAKAVISEIEELKRTEAVLTVIQAQSFSGLLPMQASKLIKSVKDDASKLDQKDHKKSKESDSYKMSSNEKSGSKEKHKYSNKSDDIKKPSSWNDVKEWGYDMATIRHTRSKRSYRSDSDSTKLEECLGALDGVVKMRNPLNVKTQNGNIKMYPQEIVKYTLKSPSISYSENPKNCHSFFPNRTRVLAVTPVSRAEICNKFISDSLSPKNYSDKPITSRNWFSQDFLMPIPNAEPKDEKLITKGYGLSVLTENYKNTNWDDSDDEKETEEIVPIRPAEENSEQLQAERTESISQVVEKSDILEKPLKYKEDTAKIKNDRRTSDECDRKGTEKNDKIKHSDEKKDVKKTKEKHSEPVEKKEQHGSMALQDTSKTNVRKEKEEKFDKQHDVKNNECSKHIESVDPTSDRCRTPNTDEYRPDWELGEDILPPDIDTNCLGIPKLNELSPRNWESDDDYYKTDRNIKKELHLKDATEDNVGKYRNMSNERKSKDSRENYSHKKDSKSREKTDEKDRYFSKKYSENNTKSYDEVKDNSKSKNKSKDYIRSNQRHNISTDSEKEIKSDSKVKLDLRPRDASRSRSRGDSRPKSRSDSKTREDLRPREKIDNYKRNRSRSSDEKKFEPNINERVRDDLIFNEKLYNETKISGDRNRNETKWNEERLSPERYRENWDFARRQDDDLQMYNRTKDDLRFRSNSKYDDLHSDFKNFNVETDKYREDRKFSEIFDHELNERRDYNQQYERGMKTDEYNELFDRPSSIKEPHNYEVGQKYRGDEKGYRYSPQLSNHNDDSKYKSSHRNDWEEEDDIKPDYRKEEHWNDRRKWEEYQRSPYENFRENSWRDKNWEKEDDYRYSKDGRRLRWQEWQDEQINEFRMRERKLHSDERYPNESYFLEKDYLERNDDRLRRSLEREGYNKSRRSVEKQDTERRSLEREGYNKPRYPEKVDTTRRSPEREGYNKPRYPEKTDSIRRSLEREGYNKPRYPEKADSIRRSLEREGYNKLRYPEKTDTARRSLEREGYNKPRYPEKTDIARRSLEREGYNKPRYPEKVDTIRRSLEREGYNKPRYPEKVDTTRRSMEREGYNKPRYPEKIDTTRRSSERESYNKSRKLSEKQDICKLKSTEKDNSNKRRKSFEEHSVDNCKVAEKENTNKKRLSEKHDVDKLNKLSDKEYCKPREPIEKQEIHKSRQSVDKEGSKSKRSLEKVSADKSRKSVEREGYSKSKQDIEKESFYSNSKQDDKSLEKGNNKSKKSSEKETAQSKWSPERRDDKKLTEINISKKLIEQKEGSRSEKNSDHEKNSDKIQKSIEKEYSHKSKKPSEKGITVDKIEETLGEIDLHKSKKLTEKDYDKSKRKCVENDDSETYKLLEDTSKTKKSEKGSNERKKDITVENKTKNIDCKEPFLMQQPDELLIRPVSPNLKSNDKLASEYEEFIKTVGCESENDATVNKEDNTDKSTKVSTSTDSSESSSEEVKKKSKKKTLSKKKSKSASSYESSSESEEEVSKKHKKSTPTRKKNEKSKSKKSKKVSSESSSSSSTSESSSGSTSSTDSSSESSSSSSSSTSSSSSSSESEEASKSDEKLSVEKIKIKEEKLSDDEKKSAPGASKKRKRKTSDSSDVSSSSTSSSSEDESEESDQTDKVVTDNSEVIKSFINKKVICEENLTVHELTKDNLTKTAEKSDDKEHRHEMEDSALANTVPKTNEIDTVFKNIESLQTIPTKIYQLSDYKQSVFEEPISFSSQPNKNSLKNTDVENEHNVDNNDVSTAAIEELLQTESKTLNSSVTDSLLHKRTHEDDSESEENQNKKICTDDLMPKSQCENTENYPNNFNSDSTSQYLVKDKSDFDSKHDEFRSSSRQNNESDYRRDYGRSGRARDSLERSDRSRSRGSKRDRYEYERGSKRSRHSRSRSRDRSRNRDRSKRARSRERHRSKDRERSREDYDINRGYDRRRRSESQTKRESQRIPKDVENVDSIPLPERMWHGNSDLTYMNMELEKSPSSPLDGFKRSVADSTISDSELLRMQAESSYYNETDKRIPSDLKKYKPTLPSSPADSPIVSPRRISLDDRINQVLGIDKEETPKPIETVGSHEGTYSNYYDQYHGYAQQYDNYRMPMKSMVPPLPTNYYQGMQICRETTAHGSQVLQVGNVLQVVPTELPPAVDKVQATILPPQNVNKNASTTKVVQVGNMLQIVPTVITTEKKAKPKLSDLPLPPVHDASEESPQPATETAEVEAEKEETKPVQEDEVALRRKERAKRRADREQRRKEKELKRVEKEKRRELRIKLRTENMIKRALQLETRELSLNLDESEILQGTEDNEKNEKSGPTMWPPPMLAPVPLPQPPAKGILITSGFSKLKNKEDDNLDEETKKIVKKSVKFADGICPGEGTSPSGGEELPSPPPPSRKLPKEQRYKKTKLKTKKKVKVKIIRNALQAAEEEDDEDDNLPPPPPPPGSPPPHLWPKQSRPNNINPTVGFAHPSTNQPYPPVLSTPAAFGIQAQMGPGPPGAYPPSGPMPAYPTGFPQVGPPPPSGPYPGYAFQPRPGYNAPGGSCIPRVSQPPGGVYHPPVYPVTGSPARPFGPPPPPMQAHPPVYGMAYNNLSSSKSHRKTM